MECSAAMNHNHEHKHEAKHEHKHGHRHGHKHGQEKHGQEHGQEREREQLPLVIVRADTKGPQTPLEAAQACMARHNMPYGLLPMESLTEFVFNPNDGRFKCTQPAHECDAVFGGHRLKLARELSGRIEDNHIHDLKGVRVKAAAFLWLNIWSVDADPKPGKMLHFHAGPFNASLDSTELWEYRYWAPAFIAKKKGGKGKKKGRKEAGKGEGEGEEEEEEEDEEDEAEQEGERLGEAAVAAIEAALPIGKAAEQFSHKSSKIQGARAAGSIPRA